MNPDRAAPEPKEALRARPDPAQPDTPIITTLRRRYESVHALQDRLRDLETRIESSRVDLEGCAAAIIDSSLRAGDGSELTRHLDALHSDAMSLDAAHEEVATL